jgi:hypothetical protein
MLDVVYEQVSRSDSETAPRRPTFSSAQLDDDELRAALNRTASAAPDRAGRRPRRQTRGRTC